LGLLGFFPNQISVYDPEHVVILLTRLVKVPFSPEGNNLKHQERSIIKAREDTEGRRCQSFFWRKLFRSMYAKACEGKVEWTLEA